MNRVAEPVAGSSTVWDRVRAETQYVMCHRLGVARGFKEAVHHCLLARFGRPDSGVEARANSVDDPEILRHILRAIEFAPDVQALWDLLSLLDQRHIRHD